MQCSHKEAKKRFEFTAHVLATNLLDPKWFSSCRVQFLDEVLTSVVGAYPFLNRNNLKTELQVAYTRVDFQKLSGATELLELFIQNNLNNTFGEVMLVLKLVGTISEIESSFITLNRVRTFLTSAANQEYHPALTVLLIEKEFTKNMASNWRVIYHFLCKKT